jgi:hypothetical protein
MSLSVLYGVFASSLSRTRRDTQLSEASMLAQSLLARAGSEFPITGEPISGDWTEYTYQVTQREVSAPEGQRAYTQPTVQVTARVTWGEATRPHDLTLSTLKLWINADQGSR